MQTGKKHTERPTSTDWERVKREAAKKASVPFDAETDPCDPNDPQVVADY